MITGRCKVIAHIGYPTGCFKAPMIYNPWFEAKGIDAVVTPLGVKAEDFAVVFPALFRITSMHGALITMPHKVSVTAMVDELSVTAQIANSCNAVLRRPDGSLRGDTFDGTGFLHGALRKGLHNSWRSRIGSRRRQVGSAIAAPLAAARLRAIGLFDT